MPHRARAEKLLDQMPRTLGHALRTALKCLPARLAIAMKQQSETLQQFWQWSRSMACRWLWVSVLAASSVHAQSALIGGKLISRGDSIERARDVGGKPDRLDRIEGDAGAPPMEIWTYQRRDRTITLWAVEETVVRVKDQAGSVH